MSTIKIGYFKPPSIDIQHLEEIYHKTHLINENPEEEHINNPFQIENFQNYQPIYSLFFDMTETNYNSIQLNHRYHFTDTNTVYDTVKKQPINTPIFIKYSPLYDPIRYMIGKYDLNDPKLLALPSLDSTSETVPQKFLDTNNASYTDGFFYYLSSQLLHQHNFKHGIDFYGSFLGIQKKFRMNIYDDYDHLHNSTFFRNNCGKLFHLPKMELANLFYQTNNNSRANKHELEFLESSEDLLPIIDTDLVNVTLSSFESGGEATSAIGSHLEEPEELTEIIYTRIPEFENFNDNDDDVNKIENSSDRISTSNIVDRMDVGSNEVNEHINLDCDSDSSDSEQNYSTDSSMECDDMDDWTPPEKLTRPKKINSASGGGSNATGVTGRDVVSSAATGCIDSESESDDDDHESTSDSEISTESNEILDIYIDRFPIQMICMEKCQGTLDELFVTDQIDEKTGASALFQIVMILLTYQKAFWFTHNDLHTNNIMYTTTNEKYLYYKFNQQIYRVPTYGRIFKIIDYGRSIYKFQGKLFCSDSFATGGDAATQYNFGPYYNEKKTILEPNRSFDLCRLGTSIFDFLFDIDDMPNPKYMDDLQTTIYRWCQDDSNKNVLYKKNGEERYPNFKLYKMIARTVHKHTPENQFKFPFFQQFRMKKNILPESCEIMDIDALPSYDKQLI